MVLETLTSEFLVINSILLSMKLFSILYLFQIEESNDLQSLSVPHYTQQCSQQPAATNNAIGLLIQQPAATIDAVGLPFHAISSHHQHCASRTLQPLPPRVWLTLHPAMLSAANSHQSFQQACATCNQAISSDGVHWHR